MSELRTSIVLDLAGNLQARARQFTGSLQTLGRRGSTSMRMLSRGVSAAGRGLDRLGNRYTTLITGAAGVGTVRMIGNLEERFVRIGNQAGQSAEAVDALKKQIFEVAKSPDIRVDPGQITAAVEQIIDKTGDLKFAEENIRNIGLAIQATGAEGQAIGGIMAEFQKMGLDAKRAFEALDILTVQGKEGAFTLQNLANLGSRVVTAYTAMGRTGVPAIREMGAALQVIRQGTGSSEMAATAFEALLRTLSDAEKVKTLQGAGIQIFEPGSDTVMRSLPDIMDELIRKTKGSKLLLSRVFDAEAIRAFNAAAGEFQRTGSVENLQKFYSVQADGSTITADSIRAAKTFNAALTNLYTVWQQFADDQLTEPIKKLTNYLDDLKPGTVENWLNVAKYVGMIGGGLVLANQTGLFKLGGMILNRRKGGLAGAAGGLGGGMGGPIPVYVVNSRMSMLDMGMGKPGVGGPGGAAARTGNKILEKTIGRIPSFLSKGVLARLAGMGGVGSTLAGTVGTAGLGTTLGAVGAAGAAGYGIGTLANRYLIDGTALGDKIGETLNRVFAFFGSEESRLAIEINAKNADAKVTRMKAGRGQQIEVDTGRTMQGGY